MYLGGAVCGDGKTGERGTSKSTGRANARRAVEGVMANRRISKRLKGKVITLG